MVAPEAVSKSVSAIFSMYRTRLSLNRSGKLLFDGKPCVVQDLILGSGQALPPNTDPGAFSMALQAGLIDTLRGIKEAESDTPEIDLDEKSLLGAPGENRSYPLSRTFIYRDCKSPRAMVLCDDRRIIASIDLIQSNVKSLFHKQANASRYLLEHSEIVNMTYQPKKETVYVETEKGKSNSLKFANTWQKPLWADSIESVTKPRVYEVTPACLQLYHEFMEAFVLTKRDRITVESFMRDSLFDKAQTALVLLSTPGTGKSTLSQIIGGLHGRENWIHATPNFKDSVFDGAILNKTFLMLDEIPITATVKEKIKLYLNDFVSAERKFENMDESKPIFVSIAAATNDPQSISVTFQDRRFNIPQLRKSEISPVAVSRENIKTLQAYCNDGKPKTYNREFMSALADYLYRTYSAGSSIDVDRNPLYHYVCLNHYRAVRFKRFLKFVQCGETFHSSEFNRKGKDSRVYNMSIDDVTEFVQRFFRDSNLLLGRVFENIADGWTFEPTKGIELGIDTSDMVATPISVSEMSTEEQVSTLS